MELMKNFENVMENSVNMALATCVGDKPNVRIVTFGYYNDKRGRVFFSTFKKNQKTIEFEKNQNVVCMPLPQTAEADTQVRIFGKVQKSEVSLEQLIDMITLKYPDGANALKTGGKMMEIYEVCFTEAFVTIGMTDAKSLKF